MKLSGRGELDVTMTWLVRGEWVMKIGGGSSGDSEMNMPGDRGGEYGSLSMKIDLSKVVTGDLDIFTLLLGDLDFLFEFPILVISSNRYSTCPSVSVRGKKLSSSLGFLRLFGVISGLLCVV